MTSERLKIIEQSDMNVLEDLQMVDNTEWRDLPRGCGARIEFMFSVLFVHVLSMEAK